MCASACASAYACVCAESDSVLAEFNTYCGEFNPYCGEFIRIDRIHQERSVMTLNAVTRLHRYASVSTHVKTRMKRHPRQRSAHGIGQSPHRAVHVSEARMGLVNGHVTRPTQSRNNNPRCSDISRLLTCTSCADINITQPASKGSVR